MRRFSLLAALAVASFALATGRLAHAGTAIRLDVAGLVDRADLVLEARVSSARAVLGPANRIDTEYTLVVERTFFGDAATLRGGGYGDAAPTSGTDARPTRVIRMPGGVLPDGRGMVIPGLPALVMGERAILFLTRADATGMRMPVGLAQGRMRVIADAAGKKSIVREQADLALVDARTGAAAQADAKAYYDYAATVAEIEARAGHKRATERR